MPYVGRDLQRGNYLKLDDISSSFNGSLTTFNLTSGGNAFFPGSAFSIIVSLGGVVQEPESAFQIDRSQIIFATAPTSSSDFFCIALGVALGVGVPGHNTVNNDQLAKPLSYGDYFRWDSANNRVGINTLLPSTALDVVGDATFSGAVSIGGTLTYEDVANIDAVGIITARAGIEDKTLTAGRVVYVGTNGRLVDNSTLTFNPTTLNVPGLSAAGVSTFTGNAYFGSDIYLTDDSGGYEKVEVGVNDIRVESKHIHSEFGVWTRSNSIGDRRNGMDGDEKTDLTAGLASRPMAPGDRARAAVALVRRLLPAARVAVVLRARLLHQRRAARAAAGRRARVRVRARGIKLLRAGPGRIKGRRELPKGGGVVLPLLRRRGVF